MGVHNKETTVNHKINNNALELNEDYVYAWYNKGCITS